MTTDRLVDKRIVERNIQKGLLTEADFAKFISGLPDLASQATFVDYSADDGSSDADDDEQD